MDSSSKDKYSGKAQQTPGKTGSSADMTSKDKPKSSLDKMQDKNSTTRKPAPK